MTKVLPGTYIDIVTTKVKRRTPDLNKVINAVRMCGEDKHTYCPYKYPDRDDISVCHNDLMDDVMSLLETLVPRVLQFGELLEYKGAVWPELTFGDGHHEVMPPCISEGDTMSDGTTGLRSTSSILRMEYSAYGKTWRCWTQKPTDAQREEEPWANDMHKRSPREM